MLQCAIERAARSETVVDARAKGAYRRRWAARPQDLSAARGGSTIRGYGCLKAAMLRRHAVLGRRRLARPLARLRGASGRAARGPRANHRDFWCQPCVRE